MTVPRSCRKSWMIFTRVCNSAERLLKSLGLSRNSSGTLDDFHEIRYWRVLVNAICTSQFWLKSDRNNKHSHEHAMRFYMCLQLNSFNIYLSEKQNVSIRSCRGRQYTYIRLSVRFRGLSCDFGGNQSRAFSSASSDFRNMLILQNARQWFSEHIGDCPALFCSL
jgi:hypothetical protein